ncbi:pyruvate dehydrogenase (acetyl-transferring) E1 component subunit alpha [Agromyces sp. MMS24-JH15]|uniref:pyruvate dehydrogenase (acetyl-transferring) E1 component subunit alpha n=1 Tax=Agromyces sp. MMS24-JH15 TaxID=3243765 RepID=UPI0037485A78
MRDDGEPLLPREVPLQLIDPSGRAVADPEYEAPGLDRLVEAYRGLVVGRRVNEECTALVRQGRLAVYPSSHGQEACQVAAALALADGDWLFPTYRDSVAVITRGVDPEETLTLLRGDWHSGYDPRERHVAPQATPLATQLLHAVGVAQAARFRGEPTVVLAMCGDGATSEGDFHEAMNFAAVFAAPVVFFVQNNEFAISVPLSRQSAASSLAAKGVGYGVRGIRVDGNDVAAVLALLDEAVAHARAGGGATLVEAHTYRMQAHTNADDDTRYREREDVAAWVARDPLTRVRTFLVEAGALTDRLEDAIAREADAVAADLREAMGREAAVDPEDLFRFVYAQRTPQLEAQWLGLQGELARAGEEEGR